MSLLWQIENHLRGSGTPATRFGREAARDPMLVHDMRRGREPRPRLAQRIRAHIAQAETRR